MTYVITGGCCNDATCISVCPADCIRPRPGDPEFISAEQLYIDPDACVECMQCVPACPVSAIYDEYDLPPELEVFTEINAEYFEYHPLDLTAPAKKAARRLTDSHSQLRVAVIGAGPSGCFAAEELSAIDGVQVNIFDRLPTPFGLVRAGVAPDHQATKGVTKTLQEILEKPNVSCYFNVEIGNTVTAADLLETHHAVIYAAGANDNRTLGVAGEDLPGVHSAREFVAWYNGHPDHATETFDLSGERAVIIGNGNVALDVARVLATPASALEATDIADHALDALRHSNIREVIVSARRGVLDAAYTTAEFMALRRQPGVDVVTLAEEVQLEAGGSSNRFGAQRRRELAVDAASTDPGDGTTVTFRYMLTPVSIDGDDAVEAVTYRRTAAEDEKVESIPASLVLTAIGYRAAPAEGLPFDEEAGTIPNNSGRVHDPLTRQPVPGVYVTGWAKRGATGIIGTNRADSSETVAALFADYAAGHLPDPAGQVDDLDGFIRSKQPDAVNLDGWSLIDAEEVARGAAATVPRVRSKFFDVDDMLRHVRA